MAKSFSDYSGVFFWDFKRMDNTNYNFEILETLCRVKKDNGDNSYFNKPIIITIVSIIECILYDFVRRVTEHRRELIPNLDQTAVDDTRGKILDQLEPLVAHIRKNNLLRASTGDSIYDDLDYLRRVRNRIHIQNYQQQLARDEHNIWTDSNIKMAGQTLERVCEVLCHVYPRPNADFVSITDFPRHW